MTNLVQVITYYAIFGNTNAHSSVHKTKRRNNRLLTASTRNLS